MSERVTTGSEPRRWRTQTHTIPVQVGSEVECYGLGVYPGPIAYLAFPSWADDDVVVPHIGLLPGQVDALLNALKDTRLCFEENGDPRVVEPGHDEQTEDEEHEIVFEHLPPWQPDPRTVAAVVEALRDYAAKRPPTAPGRYAIASAADFIAERFNLSPSQEPGGTDGQ